MISLIIPCYNEQDALPIFHSETTKVMNGMGCEYELLFINDGSKDETLAILKALAEKDQHVSYLSFSRNFGKEAAMYAGFCNAHGDYIAIMDADMQDPPELLPKMMEILKTGEYDSVATRRISRKGEPPIRSFFARKFYQIINTISDSDIVDGARDFRLMKKEMVDAIVSMSEYNRFSKGIFGWIGFRTYWLPYENVALLFLIVIRKLAFGDPVAGWASTICVIIFIGGIQLFCLGIMGQYIAKTYMETKQRPHYIISETNVENVVKLK